MTYFVNCQEGRHHNTVDQYSDRAEATAAMAQYQRQDFGRAFYYLSKTPRPNWKA